MSRVKKGIILAGGTGSRLFPLTTAVNKQLLPIYDKPLIYYPLSILMKAGIRDILIITSSEENIKLYKRLFRGFRKELGLKLTYAIQKKPAGIAQAFIIGKKFIGTSSVALALGDNIFYGSSLDMALYGVFDGDNKIFGCRVKNPSDYGVAVFDRFGTLIEVEEKPKKPQSHWAVPGLYFFDNSVIQRAEALEPSGRGELEITDISNSYAEEGILEFIELPGVFWFDAGTYDGLLEASQFVKAVQSRTGENIADLHGIAKSNKWII